MKILLIGGSGQLGRAILNTDISKSFEILSPDSVSLNLSDKSTIDECFENYKPDVVINCAAYTNVDMAEENKELTGIINIEGPEYLATKVEEFNSFFIQLSTDYVFGKDKTGPFSNLDKTGPLNYYGQSKRDSEEVISKVTNRYLIIRTASLMSEYEGNFANFIISNLLNKQKLNIIKNQFISVTYALYLAECINKLIFILEDNGIDELSENNIIHFTNNGYTDWYSVAIKIQEILNERKLIDKKDYISPIMDTEWKSLAKRPNDSRLLLDDNVFKILNINQKKWDESLLNIIDNYIKINRL